MMAQIIMMAKHYNKLPSEVLGINDEYVAFCFNEAAFILENNVIDKEGKYRWNKVKWKKGKTTGNKELINFIKSKQK
jgi:hypothetical protein